MLDFISEIDSISSLNSESDITAPLRKGPSLGMRFESVDMSEFTRRMEGKIYDQEEFQRAALYR